MSTPSFLAVQRYLKGMGYPAARERLVEHARGNGAGEDVLGLLGSLQDRTFEGPDEVSGAIAEAARRRGGT